MFRFRRVEKYQTDRNCHLLTSVRGYSAAVPRDGIEPWATLDESGILWVRSGYYWDGASGPAIDTASFMQASLAHDVLYEMIREGSLPWSCRREADRTLIALARKSGMPRWRAAYVYTALRWFGGLWLRFTQGF